MAPNCPSSGAGRPGEPYRTGFRLPESVRTVALPYRGRMTDTPQATEAEVTFADLGLDPRVLQSVQDVGYETPSPIQAATIPPLLEGRDVVGLAQTGTGKT